ncbi:MAG: potassium channel family protein [Euryarchaeota archaeon]|nr:potassium channel family protein [Euryarchaeota archaeon]
MAFRRERAFLRTYWGSLYRLRREIAVTFLILTLLTALASAIVYWVEHPVQPMAYDSYWTALYWGVMTLTTVGYGDVAPMTPVGRTVTVFFAPIGISYLLMTISVLATAYVEATSPPESAVECPNCGERFVHKTEKADMPRAQLR